MASERALTAAGKLSSPGSSRSESAQIALRHRTGGASELVLIDMADVELARAGLSDVTVTSRIADIPRQIVWPDGRIFETPDNDAIDAILRAGRDRRRHSVQSMERWGYWLLLAVPLIVLMIAGFFRYGLPLLIDGAVAVTPPAVETAIGYTAMKSLDRSVFSQSDLPQHRQAELRDEFRRFVEQTGLDPDGFELFLRGGGRIGPNAFALPGGVVVLTDELVDLADGDDEMIVAVLGHEIGHVVLDHSMRQVYRALGIAGTIALITGDIGSGLEDLMAQGGTLLALSYSRAAESEADRFAVEAMIEAGRDPDALARFFRLIESEFGEADGGFISTHPATAERIGKIEDMAKAVRSRRQND